MAAAIDAAQAASPCLRISDVPAQARYHRRNISLAAHMWGTSAGGGRSARGRQGASWQLAASATGGLVLTLARRHTTACAAIKGPYASSQKQPATTRGGSVSWRDKYSRRRVGGGDRRGDRQAVVRAPPSRGQPASADARGPSSDGQSGASDSDAFEYEEYSSHEQKQARQAIKFFEYQKRLLSMGRTPRDEDWWAKEEAILFSGERVVKGIDFSKYDDVDVYRTGGRGNEKPIDSFEEACNLFAVPQAQSDFEQAKKLSPDDTAIDTQLKRLKQAFQQHQNKEKKKYARLFDKMAKDDGGADSAPAADQQQAEAPAADR